MEAGEKASRDHVIGVGHGGHLAVRSSRRAFRAAAFASLGAGPGGTLCDPAIGCKLFLEII